MRTIITMLTLLGVAGCASVTGSKLQPVSVQTVEGHSAVAGAGCTLTNDAGKWFVTTPGSTTVHKSTGDLSVDCAKDGNKFGHETLVSKSNASMWGNILVGGIIGYAVDSSTGAGFDYPSSITVFLTKLVETVGVAQPALPIVPAEAQSPALLNPAPATSAPAMPVSASSPEATVMSAPSYKQMAEDVARSSCTSEPQASLVDSNNPVKFFNVMCTNGQIFQWLSVRCEKGACQLSK